jgi:hypothetical protein
MSNPCTVYRTVVVPRVATLDRHVAADHRPPGDHVNTTDDLTYLTYLAGP